MEKKLTRKPRDSQRSFQRRHCGYNSLQCPCEAGDDKTLKVYYNAKEWKRLADNDAEVRAFLRFLTTQKPESELTEDIMTEVETARHNEPWRKEFFYLREIRERSYNEGYNAAHAVDQARIAELETELARYKAAAAN